MSKDEDAINNLVAEIRILEGTFNELTSRQNILERMVLESRTSLETISGLGSSSEEVLLPVGGGVLLRTIPPKTDRVLVNIGANVVLEKTKESAVKFIETRVSDIEGDIEAVASQRSQIAQRLDSDRRALQSFLNKQGQ